VQGHDVRLGHLERFVFGQLALVVGGRHDAPEPVERLVQAVHAAPLARVRRQPPALPVAGRRVGLCTSAAAATETDVAAAETVVATAARRSRRQPTAVSRRLFVSSGGDVTVTVTAGDAVVVVPLKTGERVVERVTIVL